MAEEQVLPTIRPEFIVRALSIFEFKAHLVLEKEFAIPVYDELRILVVDEISSKKGHHYFTIVMNLEKTKVIWVGKNRNKKTLGSFFKELGPDRCKGIQAVAIDMWDPYIASIKEYAAQAEIVFDKFHVINKYSKVIDRVRIAGYKKVLEADKDIIKGTKYLLLKDPENLKIGEKDKLSRLLELNENINMTCILKDDLKRLYQNSQELWIWPVESLKISINNLKFRVYKAPLRKEVELRITPDEKTKIAEVGI